jgi:class III poly(R)-hydroxyalkanoic acid synthase PhaE subunit
MGTDLGAEPAKDFFERLIGLGRAYFSLGEQFAGASDAGTAVAQWLDQMTKAFQSMAEPKAWSAEAPKDFAAFWQLPMDTWQRTVSSLIPVPGDFMQAIRPEGGPAFTETMRSHLDRFLSVPGVGYTRESQEQYQNLGRLVLEYERTTQNFNAALGRMGLESVNRFRELLTAQDEPVSSLRDLFNLWVDACEDVFADFSMSDEYAGLYGEMVNALMALKHGGAQLVDEALECMNMPTRREVNTLHKRLQETRRELRALRSVVERLQEPTKPAPAAKTAAKTASKPSKKGGGTKPRKPSAKTAKRSA